MIMNVVVASHFATIFVFDFICDFCQRREEVNFCHSQGYVCGGIMNERTSLCWDTCVYE